MSHAADTTAAHFSYIAIHLDLSPSLPPSLCPRAPLQRDSGYINHNMNTPSAAKMGCANTEPAMWPSTESSASAGFETTPNHDTLATQSTMSRPTGTAMDAVINTVSNGGLQASRLSTDSSTA